MLLLVSGINSRLPSVNPALISPILTHLDFKWPGAVMLPVASVSLFVRAV